MCRVAINMHLSAGQYFGAIRSQMRIEGLLLSELSYPRNSRFPRHSHENAYLLFVLEGTQTESVGACQRWYEPGVVTLHPADESHGHAVGGNGLSCLNVEFGSGWLSGNLRRREALNEAMHIDSRSVPLAAIALRTIRSEFCHPDDLSCVAIEGSLLSLLVSLARSCASEQDSRPAWLRKACGILRDRVAEPVTLRTLADDCGVHPVHLAREFQRHYRCTIGDYLRRLRVELASAAIRKGDVPLSQIALNSGFSDQAHFTRVFKRITGITPGEYRIRARSR